VLALRVAVIKCHARGTVDDHTLHLRAESKDRIQISYGAEWAATHPRTLYLLEQEVEAWSRSGVCSLTLRATEDDWA
jgi:exopolyphosphatase / guanosine-5'-triphosphate,3'-diphosphate pyrophosphatase